MPKLRLDLPTTGVDDCTCVYPEPAEWDTRDAGYIVRAASSCCVQQTCGKIQSEVATGPTAKRSVSNMEWPRPCSVKDVRSFLGLAGFYRRFIKEFSLKAKPMTELTKEKVPWKWTQTEENSFNELKKSLVIAPVLCMPNFDLPVVVTTDASLVSVGAILEQDFGQGLQPVAFDSRKLNLAETRYLAYE